MHKKQKVSKGDLICAVVNVIFYDVKIMEISLCKHEKRIWEILWSKADLEWDIGGIKGFILFQGVDTKQF